VKENKDLKKEIKRSRFKLAQKGLVAPQEKAAGRSARSGGGRATVSRNRYSTQVAANRQKRVAKAKQTTVAANRTQQRNSKLVLANTLASRADGLLEKGEIDRAIVDYREALRILPTHTEAKAGLSEALTAKGIETAGDTGNNAAVPFLTEAITLDPANDVAYAKLGEVYDANNDPAKGVERGKRVHAFLSVARLNESKGKRFLALTHSKRALISPAVQSPLNGRFQADGAE